MGEQAQGFTVYLAGPITGCNKEQQHRWRDQYMDALSKHRRDVTSLDPTGWGLDFSPLRESLALRTADVVVANMWRESIGTSIGIVQTVSVGKPVIVIDPNYIDSSILGGLVGSENIVRTVQEAAAKTDAILRTFRAITVRKGDGTEQPFDVPKLLASIQSACGAAHVHDPHLENFLEASVLQRLRLRRSDEVIATSDLKRCIFDVLYGIKEDRQVDQDTRTKVAKVIEKWQLKESYKEQDALVTRVVDDLSQCQLDRDRYAALYKTLADRPVPPPPEEQPPMLKIAEALRRVEEEFPDALIVLDNARDSARKWPFRDVAKAYRMLADIGVYGRQRVAAEAEGKAPPLIDAFFERRYGNSYAALETGETMQRYGKQRTFSYQGREIVCRRHLKVGGAGDGEEEILRIHFEHDPETHKMIIGHVGRHLQTYGNDG